MKKIIWLSLVSVGISIALECPKKTIIELESAEENIYTTKVLSNLGTPTKKTLSSNLNELTFLKPSGYKKYEIQNKLVSTCEWAPNTNTYLKSNGTLFDLKDSTEFTIYRDTNLIVISQNSYLPLRGEMNAHIQWTETASDTLNKGLTQNGSSYIVNGFWLPINNKKLVNYYATLYIKTKDGGIVNYNASTSNDSAYLVENIMSSVSGANYELDSLFLQVIKLNYVIKEELVVTNTKLKSKNLSLNELNLNLPENTKWVKIYNSRGELKLNKNLNGQKILNLESLKNGLYFIQTNNKPSQKLIIEK